MYKWVKEILQQICPEDIITIEYDTIVQNLIHANPAHIANFVVLLAKQYMYAARCQQQEIVKSVFEDKVRMCQKLEFKIAIKNDKLNKHIKKWCNLKCVQDGTTCPIPTQIELEWIEMVRQGRIHLRL